jgi:hypothetical protein
MGNGIAILDVVRDKTKDIQVQHLIMFGVRCRVMTDTDDVVEDDLKLSSAEKFSVVIRQLEGRAILVNN